MIGYIYKTTCLIENKIYVGKHEASCFESTKYLGSGIWLKRAIKKFRKENFICELVDTAETLDELWDKEKYWIDKLNACDPNIGYNLMKGGRGGSSGLITIFKDNYCKKVSLESLADWQAKGWFEVGSELWLQLKKDKEHIRTISKHKKRMADDEKHEVYKQRQREYYRKRMQDPLVHQKELERNRQRYKDPEYRKRHAKYSQTEKAKQKRREKYLNKKAETFKI